MQSRESLGDLCDEVQSDHTENKTQAQEHDDHGVDLQARALVRVQSQHRPRRTAGACGARRRRSDILERFLVVGRGATTDGRARPSWG